MTEKSPLAEDLLVGVEAIARYTGEPERRQRHLIRRYAFPHFKRGIIIYSRKSWADAYYNGDPIAINGAS